MIIKINENKERKIIDSILKEAFCPGTEKVLAIKKYMDNNFKKTLIDDIDENGYPIKTDCAMMLSLDGQPLRTVTPRELLLILDDKFPKIMANKTDRIKFFKQVLKDWFNGNISIAGILSVNNIE